MDRKVVIYGLVSTRNLKEIRYIGKTVSKGNARLYEHRRTCFHQDTYKDRWLRKEINAGYSIEMIVLDIVPEKDWEYWEKYYIALYRDEGYKLTNTDPGGKKTKSNSPNQIKTVVLSLTGKYLGIYNTIADAAREYNIPENRAAMVVSGKYKSSKGKVFIKASEYDSTKNYSIDANKRKGKAVYQYDLEGNFIKEWVKIKDASDYYKVSKSVISNVIAGVQKSSAGFQWSFNKYDKMPNVILSNIRLIDTYKDGIRLLENLTIKETAIKLGVKEKGIRKVIYESRRNYMGYEFK